MESARPSSIHLVHNVSRRLGAVALTLAALVGVGFVISLLGQRVLGWSRPEGASLFGAVCLGLLGLVSVTVFALAWFRPLPAAKARLLCQAYQLLGAALLAIPLFARPTEFVLVRPGLFSWLAVWILLFPIIAPSTLTRSLGISLLTASIAPGVFAARCWFEAEALPPFVEMYRTFHAYYYCAFLGVAPAMLVAGLGDRAERFAERLREVGGYRLRRRIGVGGMGEVWLADHQGLARPAAVKVIRWDKLEAKLGSEASSALQRFEREATTLAALRSPHTVNVYDYGLADDGSFFCAMELLDGYDLDRFMELFGPVDPARAASWLIQACHSLEEAHQRGFVHRDIKPSNLFICQEGLESDFLKVLDFGLVTRQRSDDTRLTGLGFLVGTPAFLAPEQARAGPLDGRVDIYALGCVAYYLLTGALVFQHETPMATVISQVNDEPVPPSRRVDWPIPADLEQLIMDCLEKDPERRPQTARELARRLEALEHTRAWTADAAAAWWATHAPARPEDSEPPAITVKTTRVLERTLRRSARGQADAVAASKTPSST